MRLHAGVEYIENGMVNSIRAMQVQTHLIGISNENVSGFDKVGYQRKEAVISSFKEYLGPDGISTAVDDKVGRINVSLSPLDWALGGKGYFQVRNRDGVRLTRDGRFKLDKNGYLLALDDSKVLSNTGNAIKFKHLPEKMEDIKVDSKGKITALNRNTNKMEFEGYVGVVSTNGAAVIDPKVKQGYNEYSNVRLETEFMGMMPIIRNFDANRQIYMIESQNLTKAISQLGSVNS
ncbi:flagellar hook basal-body protein [bacterium]|nr:flagellar hook basal-body protein [bacterium]